MTEREILVNEINVLPDFVVRQLLDIVAYRSGKTEDMDILKR
ncbi:MAG: hypothetical protein QME81_20325 [bacterium]|nr:hypothetical protein [bacterium]